MSGPLLSINALNKSFGGIHANVDISLEVPKGKIVALIGPNGSGKTTLFNSIVGAHPIDSGTIVYNYQNISQLRTPDIARLGLLRTFQQTRIFGRMTCLQNMQICTPIPAFSLKQVFSSYPKPSLRKVEELLEFVGLYAKRHLLAGDLSFGQQKLLELAMALIVEPRLLLLDEPTAGINPTLINGLVDRLKMISTQLGITLFVIEHNMRVVMNLAEHVICLAHGKLLAQGTPEQIQNDQRVIDAYLGTQ